MKKTLTTYEVADKLKADTNARWSYAGALALAEYLEEVEQSNGEAMELDVVAIRCDFSEYATALEAAKEYDFEPEEDDDDEAKEEAALKYLQDKTSVFEFDGGVIIQKF